MKVSILTPEKSLFEGQAKSVKLPGMDGGFEILDRHAPMISALGKGLIDLTDLNAKVHKFSIESGFSEMLNNELSILVKTAQA